MSAPNFKELVSPGDIVLELGCGEKIKHSSKIKDLGGSLICIDLKAPTVSKRELKCIKGNFYKIPFPKNKFNLVFGEHSLHYGSIQQSYKLMKKIYNSLRMGGKLYGKVHSIKDNFYKLCKKELEQLEDSRTFKNSTQDMLVHFYNTKDVMYVLQNFKIQYIKEVKSFDKPHDDFPKAHYHYSKEFLAIKE